MVTVKINNHNPCKQVVVGDLRFGEWFLFDDHPHQVVGMDGQYVQTNHYGPDDEFGLHEAFEVDELVTPVTVDGHLMLNVGAR